MPHQATPNTTPDLWEQRVDALGLQLEQSPLWTLIEKLYAEMEGAGLSLRPRCFVANEWGCPDGLPIIGVPFYLVDPRMHAFEETHADDLEDEGRILMGLRHEAGHAVNYAYRLYDEPEWTRLFGDFGDDYHDDYLPSPFSRKFVRHLPGWYGQKHSDEDFAETFAVWLTPGTDWRSRYAGTHALQKLEYVDRAMARIGRLPPVIHPNSCQPDEDELAFTIGEFYRERAFEDAPPTEELGDSLDDDLREIFPAEGLGSDAATLLWERRTALMRSASGYTGARLYVVKALIAFFAARLRLLRLRAAPNRETDSLIGMSALVTTLTANFLRTGHFAWADAPDRHLT